MKTSRLVDKHAFLQSIDVFIFDCDGVIWKGDHVIERARETLDFLRAQGKIVFFVTNNSTKSRKAFLKKFDKLGLPAEESEIFSSSFAVALYLKRHPMRAGKKAYVIGMEGICEELSLAGVPFLGGPADAHKTVSIPPQGVFSVDHVGAVIVGLDFSLSYYKIQYAQLCLNTDPQCRFIATNLDATTHLTHTQEWAGNGACVGAIRGCTGRSPIVVGKPSPLLIDYISERCHTPRERICMVGDRLDTDVLFGAHNGLHTLLTLSGVTSEEQLLSAENEIIPDFYVDSIADLLHSM